MLIEITEAMDTAIKTAAILDTRVIRRLGIRGFSLVEMLAVLSIVSILSILVASGLQSVLGNTYDGEVSDLSNSLTRARAYAMANNTYVFVGIEEVDASKATGGAQTAGNGRLGVSIVASNTGTGAASALSAANLTVVSPLHRYENVHLASASPIANLPNSVTTSRQTYVVVSGAVSPYTSAPSVTTFTWPLTGTPQYSFGANPGTVIQFNPQGEAQIINAANSGAILEWIEIDLVPTHGNNVSGTSNTATILIDGASGSINIYRS